MVVKRSNSTQSPLLCKIFHILNTLVIVGKKYILATEYAREKAKNSQLTKITKVEFSIGGPIPNFDPLLTFPVYMPDRERSLYQLCRVSIR